MKHRLILISIVTGAALVAGCNRSAQKPAVQVSENIGQKTEAMPVVTPAQKPDLQFYTFAQQGAFTDAMRSRLADSNRQLNAMNAKVQNASDELQAEGKPTFVALRKQASTLDGQLDDLKKSTSRTWSGDRTDALATYSELQTSLDQAQQWVSEKIAP